jgi:hypothetical protein
MVTKASIRFSWVCASAITAPTTAVAIPSPSSTARIRGLGPPARPEKTVSHTRIKPNSPSSLSTPANSTQTGIGAEP